MRYAATLALALAMPLSAAAAVRHVGPGDSIQAAVDAASSGDTIVIAPGTYHEPGRPCPTDPSHTCAVVGTDDLTLVGQDPAVLENAGGQDQGLVFVRDGPTAPRASAIPRSACRAPRSAGSP